MLSDNKIHTLNNRLIGLSINTSDITDYTFINTSDMGEFYTLLNQWVILACCFSTRGLVVSKGLAFLGFIGFIWVILGFTCQETLQGVKKHYIGEKVSQVKKLHINKREGD